jgi:1-acyl-sn-glycerol-3-phosphate acyltransferase
MKQKRQSSNPPAGPDWFYFFVQRVIRLLFRVTTRCEVIGAENMPLSGAYIVTANHLNFYDAPLVFISCPLRMRVLAADKWRRVPILSQFMELIGAIWVARGEADRDAMKTALDLLKSGGRLGVAPEGTRSKTGALQPGKPGAAYLADRAQVPIVPLVVTGTEHVTDSWKRLRRPHIRVVIGAPYRLPGKGRARSSELDKYTDLIMARLAVLLPAEYRGVYADHPLLVELTSEQGGAAA